MTSLKGYAVMMSKFSQYKATKALQALAAIPYDLTKEGNLTPERIDKYTAEACGYKFLYGTERVTDDVMRALNELAIESKAVDQMEQMQAGDVINAIEGYASENRAVLHTATRDFFDDPNPAKPAREAAQSSLREVEKLKAFIEKIDKENKFTDLIMIAIGGSDLGPRAHYIALQYLLKHGRRVHFISNVDPDDAAAVLLDVQNLSTTLVLVVSKSGTTLETLSNEELVRSRFIAEELKPEEHFIAITGEGSPMDDPSKYLECFHMWDWIGGRFSTTSMVGGVMLAFAFGFNTFWDLLRGANAMDKVALQRDLSENLPLLSALIGIWNHNFLNYQTLALIPYSQALSRYSAHIQQVEMESNGKHIDRSGALVDFQTGPIIWGEPGTNAQHSFFQLIHQGTAVVPVEFVGFREALYGLDNELNGTTSQEKLLSNMFAQALALATGQSNDNPNKVFAGNRPSHILLGRKLTPYALGVLLGYYEHRVAFQGFIWDINSFDQEGVQLGKVLANKVIDCFVAAREGSVASQYPLGDVLIEKVRTAG